MQTGTSIMLTVLWVLLLITVISTHSLLDFARRDMEHFKFLMDREVSSRVGINENYRNSIALFKRTHTTCLEYEIEFYTNVRQISFVVWLCDTVAIVLPSQYDLQLLALVATHFIAVIASYYGYRYMTKHVRTTVDDYNHQVKEENLYGFAIPNRPI